MNRPKIKPIMEPVDLSLNSVFPRAHVFKTERRGCMLLRLKSLSFNSKKAYEAIYKQREEMYF